MIIYKKIINKYKLKETFFRLNNI